MAFLSNGPGGPIPVHQRRAARRDAPLGRSDQRGAAGGGRRSRRRRPEASPGPLRPRREGRTRPRPAWAEGDPTARARPRTVTASPNSLRGAGKFFNMPILVFIVLSGSAASHWDETGQSSDPLYGLQAKAEARILRRRSGIIPPSGSSGWRVVRYSCRRHAPVGRYCRIGRHRRRSSASRSISLL